MPKMGFKKDLTKRPRGIVVPPEAFTRTKSGLGEYDIRAGEGQLCESGDRVAIHYDVKLGNFTVSTSRQGTGVTGGVPYGFDVGQGPGNPGGVFLRGIDEGVLGMRVGGVRRLKVPPELGVSSRRCSRAGRGRGLTNNKQYGDRQVQEIPPNATLTIDIELLSIKQGEMLGMNNSAKKRT